MPTPRNAATATLALITWAGLALHLGLTIPAVQNRGGTLLDALLGYFSFFTILTNILVALVLTVPLLAPASAVGRFLARAPVIAATTTSIIVVGVIYHFLLHEALNPQGWTLVAESIVHYAVPGLFTLHWLLLAPKAGVRWMHLPAFALYPAVYALYTVVMGELHGRYPYPFIDVNTLGYAVAFRNTFGILVFFLSVGVVVVAVARRTSAASAHR